MKLDKLWIDEFKNLKDVSVDFDESSLSTVLIGRNGSGKSNLLEALAFIFRNLDLQEDPPFKYILEYQIWSKHVRIDADPERERDKTKVIVTEQKISNDNKVVMNEEKKPFRSLVDNNRQYLPNNVFGYYSGENKRFSKIFKKHIVNYYKEIKKESSGTSLRSHFLADPGPSLRPLFFAEPSYGQFVLLTLFAAGDENALSFLKDKFHIIGVDTIELHLKEPYWHIGKRTNPEDGMFWGAKGIVGDFLDEISKISTHADEDSIPADLLNERSGNEEKFKLKINDLSSLQDLARKYVTAVKFFKILESTFISDIISKLSIYVRKEGVEDSIEFEELSEGEQQVLLIIGLLKFMDEKESLFLLDEPETHLNPHWRYNFLRMLEDEFKRIEKSHIIIATHDPLLIGSLTKEQVQVFFTQQDDRSIISIEPPAEDPRGMGIEGILTSELFDLNTTLDFKTQENLDRRRELVIKKNLSGTLDAAETKDLDQLDNYLSQLGFIGTVRDPLYSKFLVALRKHELGNKVVFEKLNRKKQAEFVRKALDEIEGTKE